jgi:hypothetical protein
MGTHVRYNLALPEALREPIIIATAREIKSQYECYAPSTPALASKMSKPWQRSNAVWRTIQFYPDLLELPLTDVFEYYKGKS